METGYQHHKDDSCSLEVSHWGLHTTDMGASSVSDLIKDTMEKEIRKEKEKREIQKVKQFCIYYGITLGIDFKFYLKNY